MDVLPDRFWPRASRIVTPKASHRVPLPATSGGRPAGDLFGQPSGGLAGQPGGGTCRPTGRRTRRPTERPTRWTTERPTCRPTERRTRWTARRRAAGQPGCVDSGRSSPEFGKSTVPDSPPSMRARRQPGTPRGDGAGEPTSSPDRRPPIRHLPQSEPDQGQRATARPDRRSSGPRAPGATHDEYLFTKPDIMRGNKSALHAYMERPGQVRHGVHQILETATRVRWPESPRFRRSRCMGCIDQPFGPIRRLCRRRPSPAPPNLIIVETCEGYSPTKSPRSLGATPARPAGIPASRSQASRSPTSRTRRTKPRRPAPPKPGAPNPDRRAPSPKPQAPSPKPQAPSPKPQAPSQLLSPRHRVHFARPVL
jgi:hypothetical protein